MEKEIKRGFKKVPDTERSVFNNEEQRRLELLWERERQKEEQVEPLKREMQSRMAQVMKEQARLKEEMAYQYTLGNYYILLSIRNFLVREPAIEKQAALLPNLIINKERELCLLITDSLQIRCIIL